MFPGIICWSCCCVWGCSRSIATTDHGVSYELVSCKELSVCVAGKRGFAGEEGVARLSADVLVLGR
jgi:hypothetical protein